MAVLGIPAIGVGELAQGLILALSRHICAGDRYIRAGRCPEYGPHALGWSVRDKICGIVGMGQCGRRVAESAKAVGMHIHYYNRSPVDVADAVRHDGLAELVRASRFLVVCVARGGGGTRRLIDAGILRELGPEGCLLNVSCGSVVNEAAWWKLCNKKSLPERRWVCSKMSHRCLGN